MLQPDLVRWLGALVAEKIEAAVAPLHQKIAEQQSALDALKNGTGISRDDAAALIAASLAAVPVPPHIVSGHIDRDGSLCLTRNDGQHLPFGTVVGANGKDGKDGKDGASIEEIAALVRQAVAAVPVPPHIVSGCVDRTGCLFLTRSDGQQLPLGTVVGKDGKDGASIEEIVAMIRTAVAEIPKPKDGRDGLGFKDMTMKFDGERVVTFDFTLDDQAKQFTLIFPNVIHRGVWRDGDYQRGDSVTRDGSTWVAMQDTATMPGAKDSHWQLACKRGQNGSQGERGAPGPPGKAGSNGRDGRDLTGQMGLAR